MSKASHSLYQCGECGGRFPKWSGRCPDCGAWNSLAETPATPTLAGTRFAGYSGDATGVEVHILGQLETAEQTRATTGIQEFDRVLGGGLVGGSVVLLGGDPGIGKSTLLLQTLAELSSRHACLYVSGEESPRQIGLRAHRLGLPSERVQLLTETCVERVLATAVRASL